MTDAEKVVEFVELHIMEYLEFVYFVELGQISAGRVQIWFPSSKLNTLDMQGLYSPTSVHTPEFAKIFTPHAC